MAVIRWLLNLIDPYRRERKELERELARDYRCPHDDYLCDKYGCPDNPGWKGDRWTP